MSRSSSLQHPQDENPLPCSLVMTTPTVGMETEEKVIGHVRLMSSLEKPRGALIETGKGLSLLMVLCYRLVFVLIHICF